MGNWTRNWPLLFGGFFFIMAIVFGLKVLVEKDLLPDPVKVFVGFIAGVVVFFIGRAIERRYPHYAIFGEAISGAGFGGFIATVLYGQYGVGLWSPWMSVLLIAVFSLAMLVQASAEKKRMLANVALIGIFLVPLLWDRQYGNLQMFVYVLIMNAMIDWKYSKSSWLEMRPVSTFFTIIYLFFYAFTMDNPQSIWSEQLVVLIGLFLYTAYRSIQSGISVGTKPTIWDDFRIPIDLLTSTSVLIAGLIMFYSIETFSFAWLLVFVAFIHLMISGIIYMKIRKSTGYTTFLLFSGLGHLLLASLMINANWELRTHFIMMIWSVIAVGCIIWSKINRNNKTFYLGFVIWILAVCYGYVTTWDAAIGEWFGTFIPFLNWGAFAWIMLMAVGFVIPMINSDMGIRVATTLISFLIFGGLITVQIDSAFENYALNNTFLDITQSALWGIYAASMFLWGSRYQMGWLRAVSAAIFGMIALKAVFYDLWNSDSLYKAALFFVLGLISFGMMMVDQRWNKKQESSEQNVTTTVEK